MFVRTWAQEQAEGEGWNRGLAQGQLLTCSGTQRLSPAATRHLSQGMQQEGSTGDSRSTHLFFYPFFFPKDLHTGRSWMPESSMHWRKHQLGWSKRETRMAVMGLKGESGRPNSLNHFQPSELAHAPPWWDGANDLSSTVLNTVKKPKRIYLNFWGKYFW